MFYCQVCSDSFRLYTRHEHMHLKIHKDNAKLEHQKDKKARSVFVFDCNFARDKEVFTNLEKFFEKIGPLEDIYFLKGTDIVVVKFYDSRSSKKLLCSSTSQVCYVNGKRIQITDELPKDLRSHQVESNADSNFGPNVPIEEHFEDYNRYNIPSSRGDDIPRHHPSQTQYQHNNFHSPYQFNDFKKDFEASKCDAPKAFQSEDPYQSHQQSFDNQVNVYSSRVPENNRQEQLLFSKGNYSGSLNRMEDNNFSAGPTQYGDFANSSVQDRYFPSAPVNRPQLKMNSTGNVFDDKLKDRHSMFNVWDDKHQPAEVRFGMSDSRIESSRMLSQFSHLDNRNMNARDKFAKEQNASKGPAFGMTNAFTNQDFVNSNARAKPHSRRSNSPHTPPPPPSIGFGDNFRSRSPLRKSTNVGRNPKFEDRTEPRLDHMKPNRKYDSLEKNETPDSGKKEFRKSNAITELIEQDSCDAWLPSLKGVEIVGDFDQQINILMREIYHNVFDTNKIKCLVDDLRQVLQYDFPDCKVLFHGPVFAGLGIKGSPIDLYIEVKDDLQQSFSQQFKLKYKQKISIMTNLAVEAVSKNTLFNNIKSYSTTGIIKFNYTPTNYRVHACFKPAYMTKSDLYKFCIAVDPRLKPLFIFIIYWAKCNKIVDHFQFKVSDLILLIIFYLQRLSKPILPPVHMLLKQLHSKNGSLLCELNASIEKFSRNENTSNVSILVEGFFTFYSEFVFSGIVISPFCGLIIPDSYFKDLHNLPYQLERYGQCVKKRSLKPLHINSSICIQDPIDLGFNCSSHIPPAKKFTFQGSCLKAMKIFETFQKNKTQEGLICKLLGIMVVNNEKKLTLKSEIITRNVGILLENDTFLVFNKLMALVDEVLNNVLKANFTTNKDINFRKDGTLCDIGIKYTCSISYNLWTSRNQFAKSVTYNSSSLEWETLISNKMIDSLYRNQMPNFPLVKFDLLAYVKRKDKLIQIDFKCNETSNDYSTFNEFTDILGPIFNHELRKICVI